MKKKIVVGLVIMAIVAFAGCGRTANDKITVVSREDGWYYVKKKYKLK